MKLMDDFFPVVLMENGLFFVELEEVNEGLEYDVETNKARLTKEED